MLLHNSQEVSETRERGGETKTGHKCSQFDREASASKWSFSKRLFRTHTPTVSVLKTGCRPGFHRINIYLFKNMYFICGHLIDKIYASTHIMQYILH